MKILSAIALLTGVALLGWLLISLDLMAALNLAATMGWSGGALAMLPFALGFAVEIAAWSLLFPKTLHGVQWFSRLWKVNMVGEAFNVLMPLGSLGGEPFKALLLKRHYGIGYDASSASLVMMQALLAMAQAPFVLLGVGLSAELNLLPPGLQSGLAFTAFAFAGVMLLAWVAWQGRWLGQAIAWLEARAFGQRLARALLALNQLESQMFGFIRVHKQRFWLALVLFFVNWAAGTVEIWVILHVLDSPLSLAECWVIESAIVLVRTATFFIPANLGSFEAATVYIVAAMTGAPDLGLALALIRRGRELLWSAAGLAIGGWYHWQRPRPL
ncbi:MAG: hypothetical protein Tsb0016_19390 [Sphingomonadales bacterium]